MLWFNFILGLNFCSLFVFWYISDNELRTKANKIYTKDEIELHQDLGWHSREMLGHISFRSNLSTTICVSLRTKHFIQVFSLVHVECLVRILVRYRAPEGDCGQVTLC